MLPQETLLLSMVFKTNGSETICIQDIKLSIRTTPVKVTELSQRHVMTTLLFITISDPFLRSIAYWILKDYNQALETLIFEPTTHKSQEKKCNPLAASGNPDIFNFYLHLRKHPLIKRRRFMHEHDNKNKTKSGARNPPSRQMRSIREEEIIDEPLTPMERQLFFKTAHAHLNSGCPALALQVLMELPATNTSERDFDRPSEDESPEQDLSGTVDDVTGDMISTGTLSDFSFRVTHTDAPANGKAEEIDWSKPVSSKLGGDSSADFDWSQPLASDLGGDIDDFDWSKPVSSKLGGGGLEDLSNGFDWSQPVSEKLSGTVLDGINGSYDNHDDSETGKDSLVDDAKLPNNESTTAKSKETRHLDVVAQQMKFSAMLKLLINELHGLPSSCEIADEDLRPFFIKWLEKELEILHKMSDYGSVAEESDEEEEDSVEINVESGMSQLQRA